jgi:enoyl-[acyl-carrier protein] reductase I
MNDFAGKCGLIVGVANKYSIAWAIAQATAARGAKLALTYQGRFEDHVKKLSDELPAPALALPCDVTSDDDMKAVYERLDQEFGGLDFLLAGAAFAPPAELDGSVLDTSREGFRTALDISAVLVDRAHPRGGAVDGTSWRRQRRDADLSWQRPRVPALQRDGRGQGGAGVERALSWPPTSGRRTSA